MFGRHAADREGSAVGVQLLGGVPRWSGEVRLWNLRGDRVVKEHKFEDKVFNVLPEFLTQFFRAGTE